MNKKLLLLTSLFTLHLAVASADRRPPYNNNNQRQNLINLRVEEEKQKLILGVDKNGLAAWFANKVGKTTGFMYGLKARFTSVVLMTSKNTNYHSNIFVKEQARRNNIINWAYPDLSKNNKFQPA